MKVNILTQPLFCNYGGILQNYALQQTLRRLGHEPLTVNVPARKPGPSVVWKDMLKAIRNLFRRWNGRYQPPFLNPHTFAVKEHELSFPQREFVAKHINKVDEQAPFTSAVCERHPADAWIVGSDQIWRPWCSPNILNSFLDFVPDSVKKIAYAASFGTDKWEISPEMTEKIRQLDLRFNAISVREESGVNLCKSYLGVDAKHVLDPTMLLSAEDYLSLTSEEDYPKGAYVATYVLDMDKRKANIINAFATLRGLSLYRVGKMNRDSFDSIESWLAGIAHAQYVITDSFHGTVFSLLFDRPVKVLDNPLRGNTRIDSLLAMLKPEKDDLGFYTMSSEAKRRLADWQKKSLDFLTKSLS